MWIFSAAAHQKRRFFLTIFRTKRSRGEMYIGYGRLCVCLPVCLSLAAFSHCCADPDVSWGNGMGALWLCTIGLICNRCSDFVAVAA